MSVSSDVLMRENSRDLLREDEPCDDEIESPINDDDQEFPTTSMRVVLVDSDLNFLRLMKNLMAEFSYQVTVFVNGDEAIAFLMKNKHKIDLVIWDFNVADINGLEALSTIGKEMDLPVAIMAHDPKKETVMKSTKYGACHFLVKPVSKEVAAVLWQHVYRKRMSKSGLGSVESDREEDCGLGQDNKDLYQSNEEGSKNVEDSGEQNTCHDQERDKFKKQRMIWTPELHQKFEQAIEQIGPEKAVPKQILKYMQENMNVEGLTRNNVASHLQRLRWQKYRQNAERNKQSVTQETREDSVWRNNGPNTALAASKPLLNSSSNLHTRVPYFTNGQAAANSPMQYPSRNYLTTNNSHFMTDPLANLPYHTDSLYQQQQYLHQPYYYSPLQSPSVITKQEPASAPAAMETPDLITNQNSPFDLGDYFPPGLRNFHPNNRY